MASLTWEERQAEYSRVYADHDIHSMLSMCMVGCLEELQAFTGIILAWIEKLGTVTQLMSKSERSMFFTIARSEDLTVSLNCSKIMAYIADSSPEYIEFLMSDMNLRTVQSWLSRSDHNLKLYTARIIGRILETDRTEATAMKLADEVGLAPIVRMCDSQDKEMRNAAVKMIARLSALSPLRFRLLTDGALPRLITISRSGNQIFPYGVAASTLGHILTTKDGLPKSNGMRAQLDAVRAIANITEEEDTLGTVSNSWVHLPLIELAKHAVGDIRCEALRAISNLSRIEEFKSSVGRFNGIQLILSLIHATERNIRFQALSALKNLSSNVVCCEVIKKSRGQELIAELSAERDDEIRRMMFAIIANMCSAEEQLAQQTVEKIRQMEVETGLPQKMPDWITNVDAAEYGIVLLLLLACDDKLMDEDADMLRKMGEDMHPAIEMFRCITFALARKTQKKVVRESVREMRAIDKVIALLSIDRVDVMREVTDILANLSKEYDNVIIMANYGMIGRTLRLIEIGDAIIQANVCRFLANASLDSEEYRLQISEEGGLSSLAACLRSTSTIARFNAARAFANLSVSEKARSLTYELGIFRQLVAIAQASNRPDFQLQVVVALRNYATNELNQQAIVREDCLEWLFDLIRLNRKENELMRQILGCLFNLSDNETNKPEFLRRGAMETIVPVYNDEDPELLRQALSITANLCTNKKVCRHLSRVGGLRPLVQLMASQHRVVTVQLMRCFANMTFFDEMRAALVLEGAVRPLLQTVQTDSTTVQRLAASALANVLINPENCYDVVTNGGAEVFVNILDKKKDTQLLEYAALSIRNLTAHDDFRKAIVDRDGIAVLMKFVESFDLPDIQNQVLAALNNISKTPAFRRLLYRKGFLYFAIKLLPDCAKVRDNSGWQLLGAMSNFAMDDEVRLEMVDKGNCAAILPFLSHPDMDIQNEAARCLFNLTKNDAVATRIVEVGSVAKLLELLAEDDLNVQKNSSAALGNLCAVEEEACVQTAARGGIALLYELLKSSDPDVRQNSQRVMLLIRQSMKGAQKLSIDRIHKEMPDQPGRLNVNQCWLFAISPDQKLQRKSAHTLFHFARQLLPRTLRDMMKRGGLKIVDYFLGHYANKEHVMATSLNILDLCVTPYNAHYMVLRPDAESDDDLIPYAASDELVDAVKSQINIRHVYKLIESLSDLEFSPSAIAQPSIGAPGAHPSSSHSSSHSSPDIPNASLEDDANEESSSSAASVPESVQRGVSIFIFSMCARAETREFVVQTGGLPALFALCRSRVSDVHTRALESLLILARNSEKLCKTIFDSVQVVTTLSFFLACRSPHLQLTAAHIYAAGTRLRPCLHIATQAEMLQSVRARIMQPSDSDFLCILAQALASVSKYEQYCHRVIDNGILAAIIEQMTAAILPASSNAAAPEFPSLSALYGTESVRLGFGAIMLEMSGVKGDIQERIHQSGCGDLMLESVTNPSIKLRAQGVRFFLNLCKNETVRPDLVPVGLLDRLLYVFSAALADDQAFERQEAERKVKEAEEIAAALSSGIASPLTIGLSALSPSKILSGASSPTKNAVSSPLAASAAAALIIPPVDPSLNIPVLNDTFEIFKQMLTSPGMFHVFESNAGSVKPLYKAILLAPPTVPSLQRDMLQLFLDILSPDSSSAEVIRCFYNEDVVNFLSELFASPHYIRAEKPAEPPPPPVELSASKSSLLLKKKSLSFAAIAEEKARQEKQKKKEQEEEAEAQGEDGIPLTLRMRATVATTLSLFAGQEDFASQLIETRLFDRITSEVAAVNGSNKDNAAKSPVTLQYWKTVILPMVRLLDNVSSAPSIQSFLVMPTHAVAIAAACKYCMDSPHAPLLTLQGDGSCLHELNLILFRLSELEGKTDALAESRPILMLLRHMLQSFKPNARRVAEKDALLTTAHTVANFAHYRRNRTHMSSVGLLEALADLALQLNMMDEHLAPVLSAVCSLTEDVENRKLALDLGLEPVFRSALEKSPADSQWFARRCLRNVGLMHDDRSGD